MELHNQASVAYQPNYVPKIAEKNNTEGVTEALHLRHGLQATTKNQIILIVENNQEGTPFPFLRAFPLDVL